MHSYTTDDMKDLLQSLLIDGQSVKSVSYENMARKPFTIYHIDLGAGKQIDLSVPHMRLDRRKSREDNRY